MIEGPQSLLNQDSDSWLQNLYKKPLVNLGQVGDMDLEGIYSPGYQQEEIMRFMSQTYATEEGARYQKEEFNLTAHYNYLIKSAMAEINFNCNRPLDILELGCGFGSATIPILQLFPQSQLIASELSLSMLVVLKGIVTERAFTQNYYLMQLNAEELDFIPNSLDVVIGAAVLHHLFNPEKVIEKCSSILKSGGVAVFFEPFEAGTSILRLIYLSILRANKYRLRYRLNKVQSNYLTENIRIWKNMNILDKTNSFFVGVDDKWIFTRNYFERMVERYGYNRCVIYPLINSDRPFTHLINIHTSGNHIILPDWVWPIVDEFENNFSPDLKSDLLTEGTIIFMK